MQETDAVFRGTFEVVIERQEDLRELLDELIEEARPLRDKEERKDFIELVARSTLGVGTEKELEFTEHTNQKGKLPNLEKAARWLAYRDQRVVTLPKWAFPPAAQGEKVRIENLWRSLRDTLFGVWPRAITLALKSSPERLPQAKSGPYKWSPGDKGGKES